MKKIYNKLVRDRIPEIIHEAGKDFSLRTLDSVEYKECLTKKLQEEVTEYLQEPCIEELADILEVVYALTELEGKSLDELRTVRDKKLQKRGGFTKKYFLEYVIES